MKKLILAVGIILASVISVVCAENNTPEFLYQKGLYLETAKADYDGAVKIYEEIIKTHEKNAEFVAKSLYRAGICYEKLSKNDKAEEVFGKLGKDYAKYLASIEGASQKVSAFTQDKITKKLKGKVTLHFENANLKNVLRYMSEVSGLTIAIDAQALNDVDGTVTVNLKNISLLQALKAVLDARGLSYQVEHEYIWVTTPDKIQQKRVAVRKQDINFLSKELKKKVSVNFDNAPLRAVLNYLSRSCGVNIVLDEKALSGTDYKVTIDLRDLSLQQALEAVLRGCGLSYQVKEEYIWVTIPDKIQQKKAP